jgi:hypothetical protein
MRSPRRGREKPKMACAVRNTEIDWKKGTTVLRKRGELRDRALNNWRLDVLQVLEGNRWSAECGCGHYPERDRGASE